MPVEALAKTPSFRDLSAKWEALDAGRLRWGGLWGSARALVTATLAAESAAPSLVIVPDAGAAELALDDLNAFGCGAVAFPARESSLGTEAEVLRARHHALALLGREGFAGVVVAPLAALLQPVPAAGDDAAALDLQEGMTLDPEELVARRRR